MSYAWKRIDPRELAWMDESRVVAQRGGWRCCDCGEDRFAPSVADERRCMACNRKRNYGWRPASFGRLRLVPPREAATWRE